MIRIKSCVAILVLALLPAVVAGCRKPASLPDDKKTVYYSVRPETSSAPAPVLDTELAPAVAHILQSAGRSGSLVYRSECGPQRVFKEIYPLRHSVALVSMDEALTEIVHRYPNLRWTETGTGLVRITDRAAHAGLLQVRIPEFILLDDRGPDDALAEVWKTPEVRAWVKKTGTRIMPPSGQRMGKRKLTGIVAIHLKNVTVAQILDAVLAGGKDRIPRLWSYRECRFKARTMVEVSVR
jgi:hypothetical protein